MLVLELAALLSLLLQQLGPWVCRGPAARHLHPLYLGPSPLSLYPCSLLPPLWELQYLLQSSQRALVPHTPWERASLQ